MLETKFGRHIELGKPVEIPLRDINLKDLTFLFRYKFEIEDLSDSIKQAGLINPVVLRQKEKYQIVCGFRRVFSYKFINKKLIRAFVLDKETQDIDCVLFALNDNYFTGNLNDIDKAMTLRKLKRNFLVGESELINIFTTLLKMPKSKEVIKNYLAISEVEDEIKEGFLNDKLNLGQLFILSRLNASERIPIYKYIILSCRINTNELKEIIEYLTFLNRKFNKTFDEILDKKIVKNKLLSGNFNPRQKTIILLNTLRDYRYPNLTKKSRRFFKISKCINIGDKLRISFPENFEGDFVNVLLKPTSYKELVKLIGIIKTKKRHFMALFRLLK
ncbi:MAG: ParB/RepB/Spo0J family partition protein [Candidatus Omnitrophica bacterium]|nr:ParB/RepB/Spo0J family partition protein [Candidatus Omnitrophota bacterium]